MLEPRIRVNQKDRLLQRKEVETTQPMVVTVIPPKVIKRREDTDFYDPLQYLKSERNDILVVSAKDNNKTKKSPLTITKVQEPITITKPKSEISYDIQKDNNQKYFIPEKKQIFEKDDKFIGNTEIEEKNVETNHKARSEQVPITTVRRDNYYNSLDFEITKIGNKYRVKRKSDNKIFTLRDKNKETVYVKNILAGYEVENNEYELISAISSYQQDQDKNRRRRNRQRLKKAGKFVISTGLVVATLSAFAHIAKNGGAEGLSQGLNNKTNNSKKKTPSSIPATDNSSTNYIQDNINATNIISSPVYSTTRVYGTTNGFQNIGPDAVIETDPNTNTTKIYGTTNGLKNISPNTIIERDPYSNTTKVYGTTNGLKNISPKAIIEEDPYSRSTKVYGTTNGLKNISPNTIIERDPYSNTTKVYGTTNGLKNISPKAIIEEDPYSRSTKVYGTTNGLKNISPNTIIKRTDY